MWKFYCDRCEKEVNEEEEKPRIILEIGGTEIERIICKDCANKVLDFLGGESEECKKKP